MKRRNFLVFSALGITSVALPVWYYNNNKSYSIDTLVVEPEYLSHIMDGPSIHDLGLRYIEQIPEESSKTKLLSLLPEVNGTMRDDIVYTIRKKIVADYRNGDTICIDGWVLSRTEARQCALFSLIKNCTRAYRCQKTPEPIRDNRRHLHCRCGCCGD